MLGVWNVSLFLCVLGVWNVSLCVRGIERRGIEHFSVC